MGLSNCNERDGEAHSTKASFLERLKSSSKDSVRSDSSLAAAPPEARQRPAKSSSRLFARGAKHSLPAVLPAAAAGAVMASAGSASSQAAQRVPSGTDSSLGRLSRMLSRKSSKSAGEQGLVPAAGDIDHQPADDTMTKSDQSRSRRPWIPKGPKASAKLSKEGSKTEDSNTAAERTGEAASNRKSSQAGGSMVALTAAAAHSSSLMSRARSGLSKKAQGLANGKGWGKKKGADQQEGEASHDLPSDNMDVWGTPSGTPFSSTTDICAMVAQSPSAASDSSASCKSADDGSGRPSSELEGSDAAGVVSSSTEGRAGGREAAATAAARAAAAGAAAAAAVQNAPIVSPFQAASTVALKQEPSPFAARASKATPGFFRPKQNHKQGADINTANTHPAAAQGQQGAARAADSASADITTAADTATASAAQPPTSTADALQTESANSLGSHKAALIRRGSRLTSWWLGGRGKAADAHLDELDDDASTISVQQSTQQSTQQPTEPSRYKDPLSKLPAMGTSPSAASAAAGFGKPPRGAPGLRVAVPDLEVSVADGMGTPLTGVGTPLTVASSLPATPMEAGREPSVRKFPRGFMWGTATSAHQVEGAYLDEGKGLNIWDAFTHAPGKVSNGASADISCCQYYRYKEDVALMRSMGVKYYRLSISWARVLPTGRGRSNERGLAFYDRLINELVANGIEPVVTLYHWDLPLSLQMEEDGWLNPNIIDHFAHYAKLCYSRYGDRVKHWITFNEPWCAAVLGHDSGGQHAPGRTLNPSREVYRVGHHMLLAHAKAYHVYAKLYKRKQRGRVGMALNGDWYAPKPSPVPEEQQRNEAAAKRALEFTIGWFARPLYEGDYPAVMRARVGNRLPRFTAVQRMLLKGSADFFGLNHYSSHLCEQPLWYKEVPDQQQVQQQQEQQSPQGQGQEEQPGGSPLKQDRSRLQQAWVKVAGFSSRSSDSTNEIQEGDVPTEEESATGSSSKSGTGSSSKNLLLLALEEESDEPLPVDPYIQSSGYWQDISVDQSDGDDWKATDMGWGVHPDGMRKMLNYIQSEFNPRGGIIITENGAAVKEDSLEDALKDSERIAYFKSYLTEVHRAIVVDDVDVRGYFAWSLLDNFEWGYGYTKKFGLHHVDLATLERTPKASAHWFANVVQRNRLELGPRRTASAMPLGALE